MLAKHDETYMPKEVADALKKQGHWKEDYEKKGAACDAQRRGGAQMIAELGHYALVLALGLALVQAIVPIWGARTRDAALMGVAAPTALAQFLFVAVAFAALTACYVTSDFSVAQRVREFPLGRSRSIYKFTGVWGNHEGSMLLWVLILRAVRRAGGGARQQPAARR